MACRLSEVISSPEPGSRPSFVESQNIAYSTRGITMEMHERAVSPPDKGKTIDDTMKGLHESGAAVLLKQTFLLAKTLTKGCHIL